MIAGCKNLGPKNSKLTDKCIVQLDEEHMFDFSINDGQTLRIDCRLKDMYLKLRPL